MSKNKKKFKLKKEEIVLIAIVFLIILIQFSFLTKLVELPGPLYGGDIYRERGYSEHAINNNPISDPLFLNETNYFPWLSHLINAKISIITGASIDSIIILFPIIIFAISIFLAYLLGKKIFKDKIFAGLFSLLISSKFLFDFKNTGTLATLTAILCLYFWFKTKESKDRKILFSVLMGATGALSSLFHGSRFINIVVFLVSIVVLELIVGILKKNLKWKEFLKTYLPAAISGAIISLIFFLPLMLKYHMKTLNNSFAYALTNIDNFSIFWGIGRMFKVFFNFSSAITAITGLMALIGLIYCIINFKKNECKLTIAIFFGTIIAGMHYLITKPLLNKWMEPYHMLSLLFIPSAIFFIFGIHHIYLLINKKIKKAQLITYSITLIIIALTIFTTFQNFENNKWANTDKINPFTDSMLKFGDWIKYNTNPSDVFLAHDETSFALNAISGAKVVMSRRVHASYFVDINKRYADGIVMLYGNNEETIKNLLKEYNVKYVYIDFYLTKSPMITELKYEDYLKENGVKYQIQNVRWDPSTADAPTFDSLVVPYQTLTIINQTEFVLDVVSGNQVIGKLYKIKSD